MFHLRIVSTHFPAKAYYISNVCCGDGTEWTCNWYIFHWRFVNQVILIIWQSSCACSGRISLQTMINILIQNAYSAGCSIEHCYIIDFCNEIFNIKKLIEIFIRLVTSQRWQTARMIGLTLLMPRKFHDAHVEIQMRWIYSPISCSSSVLIQKSIHSVHGMWMRNRILALATICSIILARRLKSKWGAIAAKFNAPPAYEQIQMHRMLHLFNQYEYFYWWFRKRFEQIIIYLESWCLIRISSMIEFSIYALKIETRMNVGVYVDAEPGISWNSLEVLL